MGNRKRNGFKFAAALMLILTLCFTMLTGMAGAAETKANQLYVTVGTTNTAYESIGRMPGKNANDMKFYYSDGGMLSLIKGNSGFTFPGNAGKFTYLGSDSWEWNNAGITPGVYTVKYEKDDVIYSMNLCIYCNPEALNLKWNSGKTAATFTRMTGVDYYVAQIIVNDKEISRKAVTGTKISVSKKTVAAACEGSAKEAAVDLVLTPFGRDADCQAYIKGEKSYPLCQRTISATIDISDVVKEEVKEEPKNEPAKEEVKEEQKQEVVEEPKQEVKEEPAKEEVKEEQKQEVKEEIKEEVKEEPAKEEVKEEPKTEPVSSKLTKAEKKTIAWIQNTTINVNTQFIMNLYGGDKIKVTWKKSPGYKVDYYQVYRSMSKTKGFKKAFTTKKTTYTNTGGIVKFETYYYKVRGVREIKGVKYYTNWSNVKKQIFA